MTSDQHSTEQHSCLAPLHEGTHHARSRQDLLAINSRPHIMVFSLHSQAVRHLQPVWSPRFWLHRPCPQPHQHQVLRHLLQYPPLPPLLARQLAPPPDFQRRHCRCRRLLPSLLRLLRCGLHLLISGAGCHPAQASGPSILTAGS